MKKTFLSILLAILSVAGRAQTYYGTVTPTTLEAGGKAEIWFNLINDGIDFTAFQMDVTLPQGFSFAYTTGRGGKITYDQPVLSEIRAEDTGHGFDLYRVSADGRTMNVIVHSQSNQNFYNTTYPDDERALGLIKFGCMADADVQPGLYQGTVTGIVFATTDKVSYEFPDITFTICVKGDGSTVTLNVTSAGVATLMLPFSADVPAGLKALRCEKIEGDAIVTTQLSGIPAHTPLLITGTPGEYTFTGTPDFIQPQYTVGVLTGTYELLNAKSGYVLQKHGGEVAFYTIDAVDGENILPYRCYIAGQDGNVRMYRLTDDATRIDAANVIGTSNAYDLSGRRADNGRGIKITNNSKILKR